MQFDFARSGEWGDHVTLQAAADFVCIKRYHKMCSVSYQKFMIERYHVYEGEGEGCLDGTRRYMHSTPIFCII